MNLRAPTVDRVFALENQVRALQIQLDALRAEARGDRHYQCRLVKTRSDAAYPAAGNAFETVFLDLDFVEAEGNNVGTLTPLSAASQRVGKTADDAYVEEDTVCLSVLLPNRKQLLLPLDGGSGQYGELYLSGFGLLAAAGDAKIDFDTAVVSRGVTADAANGKFVINSAGDYRVGWSTIIVEAGNVYETIYLKVYVNGVDVGVQYWGGGGMQNDLYQWSFASYITLAAGDELELYCDNPNAGVIMSNGIHFIVGRA